MAYRAPRNVMAASMKLRDGSAPGGTMVPATEDRTSAKMLTYAINALQRVQSFIKV